MPRRGENTARVLALLMACGTMVSTARAYQTRPEALDVTLLRADAIFVATISHIEQVAGDHYRVRLTESAVVANRWSSVPSAFELVADALIEPETSALVVAPGDDGIRAVRARPFETILRTGHRYLMFLAGGPHAGAPTDAPVPFYEIDADGHIVCGSGFVYGLGASGIFCARRGDVAGEPPLEADLRAQLGRAFAHARARRPDLATRMESAVRPIEPPTETP